MKLKHELLKRRIKENISNVYYNFLDFIDRKLEKPYNYIHDKHIKKLSNPQNYNLKKINKLIKKEIIKELIAYNYICILDIPDDYIDRDLGLDIPYGIVDNIKNKHVQNYLRYALKNDDTSVNTLVKINIRELIVENSNMFIEELNIDDYIPMFNYKYKYYKKHGLYKVKIK